MPRNQYRHIQGKHRSNICLILFLGMHSARLFAAEKRASFIAARGPLAWKGIYALVSIIGFVLIIYGYGQARVSPTWLWISPVWTRHLAALLTIPAFILIAATYVPGSCIKARVGHPMLLGVKFWALAHLIANGTLAAAVGLGLQLWIPGVVLWIVGHSLAMRGARVDPQFMAVFARHIKHRPLLDV